MERMGLVSRVTEELERMISQGLPPDGSLPSEHTLSRRYGVSRTTVREALGQLAARGLVVQHPGRRSRAVALDETVTLENLGVALHGEGPPHPERRLLLEGYLELKREMTVELLAACCEHASETNLDRLQMACFALRDAARWEEDGRRWAELEFELLRLAARAANRPGHMLLIHSLERAFWGIARRVLPHLDSQAVQQWALCALHILKERDAHALRREVLPLLRAGDERILSNLEPAPEANNTPKAPHCETEPPPEENPAPEPVRVELSEAPHPAIEPLCGRNSDSEPARDELPDATAPNLSACPTGSRHVRPAGDLQPQPPSTDCNHPLGREAAREPNMPPAAFFSVDETAHPSSIPSSPPECLGSRQEGEPCDPPG